MGRVSKWVAALDSRLRSRSASASTREIGHAIEQLALQHLQQQGLLLLAENYQCKIGEIDLILRDNDEDEIVFTEVRYRQSTAFGDGLESITWHKQQKLIKTATAYLQAHKCTDSSNCRFDVVAVTGKLHKLQFDWHQDVFAA